MMQCIYTEMPYFRTKYKVSNRKLMISYDRLRAIKVLPKPKKRRGVLKLLGFPAYLLMFFQTMLKP